MPPIPHFPEHLQQARLRRGWKQMRLAEELGVKLRTLISWETGERVPPVGIVVRQSALLETDLLASYIMDDVARHYGPTTAKRLSIGVPGYDALVPEGKDREENTTDIQNERYGESTKQSRMLLPEELQREESDGSLQELFLILAMLREQPSLIPVTLDFLQAFTSSEKPET